MIDALYCNAQYPYFTNPLEIIHQLALAFVEFCFSFPSLLWILFNIYDGENSNKKDISQKLARTGRLRLAIRMELLLKKGGKNQNGFQILNSIL